MHIRSTSTLEVTRLQLCRNFVFRAGRWIDTFIAVVLGMLSLLMFKALSLAGAASSRLFRLLGIDRVLGAYPRTASFVGLWTALAVSVPQSAHFFMSLGGSSLQDGAFLTGLALILSCAPNALAVPMQFEEPRSPDPIEAWFAPRMMHSVDAIWSSVLATITLLVLPAVLALCVPGAFGLKTLVVYGAVLWVTWNPATDFEHADSHYHFFKRHRATGSLEKRVFRIIDFYLTYILTIAMAKVPHWYEVQHVFIHHAEDNGINDTQSTLPYDRASFVDFSRCANRFSISGLLSIDIINYLIKNRRVKALRRLMNGMFVFYAVVAMCLYFNWMLAVTIIGARYVSGVISSMGFFQEHGVIDTSTPDNIYRNSLHYIAQDNTHGNRGEDFHIAHHLRPGRYWAEYEGNVAANIDRYSAERAIGFIYGPGHYRAYYGLLWQGDFIGLAKHFILFGRPDILPEEMAELLRVRTRPLSGEKSANNARPLDRLLGRAAGYLLV